MKRHLLTLMLLVLGTLMGHAQSVVLNGDLNHDGRITVEDLTMMNNVVQGKNFAESVNSDKELIYGVRLPDNCAELLPGFNFNAAIKKLADSNASGPISKDNIIRKITFLKGSTAEGTEVSSTESPRGARAIYNESTHEVDIYVDADKLVFPESCYQMFSNFYALTEIDWSAFGASIITSNVKQMNGMFRGCIALTTLDVSHFDTSKVTEMTGMFQNCNTLTTLDVSHFETSNVVGMNMMFSCCNALTSLDVTHFDTGNVVNMNQMFDGCNALTSLDVSHFNTSKVMGMNCMFNCCGALTSLDLSHFDTRKVVDMSNMFSACSVLSTLKLGNSFTIIDDCDIAGIFTFTPDNNSAIKCTITCNETTQAKLLAPETEINPLKIIWNLL